MSVGDDIDLIWRLSVEGAEEVKSKISDLHDQFNRGEITVDQYSKGMRGANSDLRTFTNSSQMQSRAWMAAHPAITQVSRSMSGFTSVMRAGLAVSNALNLATIAFSGHSSGMAALQAEAAAAQRDYNAAVADFGKDSPEAEAAMDRIKVAQEKIKEANNQMTQQMVMNSITFGTSMAFMGASIIQVLPKIATLSTSITALGAGLSLITAPLAFIGGALLGLQLNNPENLTLPLDEIINRIFFGIPKALSFLGPVWQYFWMATMPNAISGSASAIQGGLVAILNGMIAATQAFVRGMVMGVQFLANSFIDAVNGMIRAYNAVAGVLGLGKIGTIGHLSLPVPSIPLVSAAGGFNGVLGSDTMFMAHQGEGVNITPASQMSGGGGGRTTIIHVHGSIWSERDLLRMTDRALRRDLSARNV